MKNKSKEIIINKENEKDKYFVLPEIINSEVNLLVFPFFALTRSDLKKKNKIEYKDIIKRDGKKLQIIWKVTSNSEYGYPGLFDREVHKVIEQIITKLLREKGKIENPIPLGSLYNICKKLGIENYGGHQYRKIKEAFKRIKTTSIETKGTFYSKDKKQWLEDVFNIYERVIFKGEKISENEIADDNYLYLGSWYLQNLNSFYIKPIDYKYLKSLKSNIASRLYEILGVKFYGLRNKKSAFICYRYSKLCQLLPVTPHRYYSLAKQQLDPGNNELKKTGFISNYKWTENGKNDWLIYYWPGERARKEMRSAKVKSVDIEGKVYLPETTEIDNTDGDIASEIKPSISDDLIEQMVNLNVSKITAVRMVNKYNHQAIKDWIKAIDFTNAENKAAYLVKAIKENWQLPEEYLGKKREERRKEEEGKIEDIKIKQEEEENKKRQEEIKKIEQIYDSLTLFQQEEIKREAEKRLPDFWKEKLNKGRVKGTTSKFLEAALEENKREIIKEWIDSGRIRDITKITSN